MIDWFNIEMLRSPLTWIALGSGIVAVASLYFMIKARQLNKKPQPEPWRNVFSEAADLPELRIPIAGPEVLDAFRTGECVLVIGSGMSAQTGMETWSTMLDRIVTEAGDPDHVDEFRRLLSTGRLDEVVDALNASLPEGDLARRVVARVRRIKPSDMTTYGALAGLPVAGAISLNLDELPTAAFKDRFPTVYQPAQAEQCIDALSRNQFFVMMLNGSIGQPNQILLSNQNLKDAVARNDALRELLQRLYYSRPLFFIGVSLSGVQSFVGAIDRISAPTQKHHALVQVTDTTWRPIALNLEKQFAVNVLPFSKHHQDAAIYSFLSQLMRVQTPDPQRPAIRRRPSLKSI